MISLKQMLLRNKDSLEGTLIHWTDRSIGSSSFTLKNGVLCYSKRFHGRGSSSLPIEDMRDDFSITDAKVTRTLWGSSLTIKTFDDKGY